MSIARTLRELGGARSSEGLFLSAAVYQRNVVVDVAVAHGMVAVEEPAGIRVFAGDASSDVLDAALDAMFRRSFESGFAS